MHQAQANSPKQRPQEGNDEDAAVARSRNLELRFSPGEPEPHIEEDEFHNDASKKGNDARKRRRRRHRQSRVKAFARNTHIPMEARRSDPPRSVEIIGAVPVAPCTLQRRPPSFTAQHPQQQHLKLRMRSKRTRHRGQNTMASSPGPPPRLPPRVTPA